MNNKRWSRIERLCNEAMMLAQEYRESFLEDACHDDPGMLKEVKELLQQCDQTSDILDKPLISLARDQFPGSKQSDTLITGPYRIIRLIAEGGMGEVYLAKRDDKTFDHYVALKVIRGGLDRKDVLSRFNSERKILASLNHPNIARLYDGGTTEDGYPYFAMEYVDGLPLNEYCERNLCSVEERLTLFLKVCSAVQYAHRNLVVHQDLKPGNILLTSDGDVKLLDFGIANLIESAVADSKKPSASLFMTPEYASPEQIRNQQLTTSSDIYSLGVILYELLTGRLPYTWQERTPEVVEEVVCTGIPPKPSETAEWKLPADLDAIVLKTLEKKPADRYTAVEQLSEDVRHYLQGYPVVARSQTVAYRMAKFVNRHRWGVASATAVVFLILGFTLITQIQSTQIKAAAVEIEQERDRAEKISDFMIDLFQSADPSEAGDASITAKELLDRGVERAENELAGRPALKSDLLLVIAGVYDNMGLYTEAEQPARRALELQRELYGPEHPGVAMAMNTLGWIRFQQSDYLQADSLFTEALRIYSGWDSDVHTDMSRTLNDFAVLKQAMGDYVATDTLLSQALEIRRSRLGNRHEAVGITLNNYAALKWRTGEVDTASVMLEEVLEILRYNLGDDHLRVAIAMTNLAALQMVNENYDRAERLYRDALAIRYRLVGPEHPDVANNLAHLGNLLRVKEEYDQAEEMLIEALDIRRKKLGDDHVLIGDSRRLLGLLYQQTGNYEAALDQFQQGLYLYREVLPVGHTRSGDILHHKGGVYLDMEKPDYAAMVLREALGIRKTQFGEHNRRTAETRIKLGQAIAGIGNIDEAEILLATGLETLLEVTEGSRDMIRTAENTLSMLRE